MSALSSTQKKKLKILADIKAKIQIARLELNELSPSDVKDMKEELTNSLEDIEFSISAVNDAVELALLKAERENTTLKKTNNVKLRRTKDFGFDVALLATHTLASDTRLISLGNLHAVARNYEPSSKDPSVTAKLSRWRNEDEFVQWIESHRRSLTERGERKLAELSASLDETTRQRVRDAIFKEFQQSPAI